MLTHCKDFKELDIWFLDDTKQFYNRKLFIGRCPQCRTEVARLDETRISDGRSFKDSAVGHKQVEKMCDKVRHHIKTTKQDITIKKGKPCGISYGVNKEIRKKGKVVTIRQRRCDFYGQSEVINEVSLFAE